jgi:hypothetical protein
MIGPDGQPLADVPLNSVADVVRALAATFNQVRKSEVDPKTGNCLGLLAGQLLRAMQEGELAAEIEALRAELERQKHERGHTEATSSEVASGVGESGGEVSADPGADTTRPGIADGESGLPAGPVAEGAADEDLIADIPPMFG